MFLLAHMGIPLGAAWLSRGALARAGSYWQRKRQKRATPVGAAAARDPSHRFSPASRMDYRLILLGSVLPDIIDKPVGLLILGSFFSSGRIFGHTLVFSLLALAAGCYAYARRRSLGLWGLAFGSLMHLALDEMWRSPRVLLWPLHGWGFPRGDISRWLQSMLEGVITEPHVGIPEIIGGLVLAGFFLHLLRRKGLARFLRTGMMG